MRRFIGITYKNYITWLLLFDGHYSSFGNFSSLRVYTFADKIILSWWSSIFCRDMKWYFTRFWENFNNFIAFCHSFIEIFTVIIIRVWNLLFIQTVFSLFKTKCNFTQKGKSLFRYRNKRDKMSQKCSNDWNVIFIFKFSSGRRQLRIEKKATSNLTELYLLNWY